MFGPTSTNITYYTSTHLSVRGLLLLLSFGRTSGIVFVFVFMFCVSCLCFVFRVPVPVLVPVRIRSSSTTPLFMHLYELILPSEMRKYTFYVRIDSLLISDKEKAIRMSICVEPRIKPFPIIERKY